MIKLIVTYFGVFLIYLNLNQSCKVSYCQRIFFSKNGLTVKIIVFSNTLIKDKHEMKKQIKQNFK